MKYLTYGKHVLIICLLSAYTGLVSADVWSLRPHVTAGYLDYTITTSGLPGVFPEQEYIIRAPLIGLGLTLANKPVYLDASYMTVSDDFEFSSPAIPYAETLDGSRDEITLTVGYSINETLSLFAGYKNIIVESNGDMGGVADFNSDGFFAGVAMGTPIGEYGVLSLKLAAANLDQSTKFRLPAFPILPAFPMPVSFDTIAETNGVSYGIAWNSSLGKRWAYSISVNGYQYRYEDAVDKVFGEQDLNIIEELLMTKINLSYQFNL